MTPCKLQSDSVRRQMRSLACSLALVAAIGAVSNIALVSCVSTLLFPSGEVTIPKLLWLVLGLQLASIHLQTNVRQWWTTRRQQLVLVDDFTSTTIILKDTKALEVDTSQFQGQVKFNSKSGIHLQGRFTSQVDVGSKLFIALELEDVDIVVHTALRMARILLQWSSAHASTGDVWHGKKEELELPHIAFPLQMCEHVEFGSFAISGAKGKSKLTMGEVYSFQAAVQDWRWRWAIKMAIMASWMPWGSHSARLVGYSVAPPSKLVEQVVERHVMKTMRYLFSFSVHRQEKLQERVDPQHLRIQLPHSLQLDAFDFGSPISLYGQNHRGGGVPLAHAEACRRMAEDARALGRLALSLDVWVEFVDRTAGRRKVGYLMEVVDVVQQRKRTVLRSASTIKNALLLLRIEHQQDRKENLPEGGVLHEDVDDQEDQSVDFQHLVVESRHYRYGQIELETSAVARVLNQVASKPSPGRRRWRLPQTCYQHQLEKATLFRCLAAPSHLPTTRSYHAIGVQVSDEQHATMNIVYEAGVYRLHSAGDGAIPLLRQEWLVITAGELQFFRSYSATPALNVPITNVLDVRSVDRAQILNGNEPAETHHEEGAVPRWYCVEIHLVLEIITVFVETSEIRDQLVVSLRPLTNDNGELSVMTTTAKEARLEAVAVTPLFSALTLSSQTQPICLNQRTSRFASQSFTVDASVAVTLVRETLEAGLEVFALGEAPCKQRISRAAVLRFLDKVEMLNGLDLDEIAEKMSNDHRFALALNLYHALFIHAVLVFGYPQTHEQWKLIQTVPCYLVRISGDASVRFTLADIQRVMLRCPVPVTLEASGIKRSLSQNALMDLAIGSGDAIEGLCRTVLGVSWTPTFPNSSSYTTVKIAPLPIPSGLAIERADIRTSMVLQINSLPPLSKSVGIMHVYDAHKQDGELNATCSDLRRELHLDEVNRVIYLPRICEWYHNGEVGGQNDGVSRRMGPLSQRRRRSSSGSISGLAAVSTSRNFFCLQRLLGFMEVEQHHRVMHLLLGAGEECRLVFDDFWTRPSRSAAVSLLSDASAAALSVFTGVSSSNPTSIDKIETKSSKSTDNDNEWNYVAQ